MDITNTTNDKRTIFDGLPENIMASEAHGQAELVNSEQLPIDVRGDKAKLEAAGVVFGEPSRGDDLFCQAVLPKGWKKESTDHSMWSKLVDADGNERAMIFYKAAFYDRCAFMSVTSGSLTGGA